MAEESFHKKDQTIIQNFIGTLITNAIEHVTVNGTFEWYSSSHSLTQAAFYMPSLPWWAGEKAQRLRPPPTHLKVPSSISNNHMVPHNHL